MTDENIFSGTPMPAIPVESMLYYYGNISRETAEWILWDRGCLEGMYLLRESNSDFVLSLCYQKSVLHYRIKKLHSGEVGLCGVPRQKFAGPVELVDGVEGLACKPIVPCNKSLDSVLPLTHWGVTEEEIRKAILKKAKEWGIDEDKLDSSLTENYNDIKLLITKTLHEVQPWFHGPLSRVEAEKRIEDSGHKDGKFLVRERDGSSYALCLSHSGRIKHYKIDVLPSGEFAIQDGQRFPSIMALVSHYTLFSDGLWCSLQDPCPIPVRRSSENSQGRSRSHDGPQSSESRNRSSMHHQSGGSTLERSRTLGGHHSPSLSDKNTMQSRTSRFLSSFNHKGLFSRIVSTVAPHIASQTLPPNSRHSRSSEHSRHSSRLYPSLSDDNLDGGDIGRNVHMRTSPVLINTNPSTPSSSRKSSLTSTAVREESNIEGKKARIHKASSFDLLPAFLSVLLYGENSPENEKKARKKTVDNCHKNTQTENDLTDRLIVNHSHCNGMFIEMSSDKATETENTNNMQLYHKSTPLPARPSLAKKIASKMNSPIYANRNVLVTSGRSISLGETGSISIPEEEPVKIVQNGLHISQPFIRSASSPSVVSHSKSKLLPPSRLPHSSTSEMKGSESLPNSPLTPLILRESGRVLSLNGQLNTVQAQDQQSIKLRNSSHKSRTETGCNSCASTNSSASPTLTELSELGQDSFSEDMVCGELELDLQDIELQEQQRDLINFSPSEMILRNEELQSDVRDSSIPTTSEVSRTSRGTSPFLELLETAPQSPENKDGNSSGNLNGVEDLDQSDNSTYATLSLTSDVIFSLSGDLHMPSTLPPVLNPRPSDINSDKGVNSIYSISREESELAYLTLRRCRRGPLSLDSKLIALKEKISSGSFGEVHKGVYSVGPVEVQFAIKTLRSNSVPNPNSEILKEAQTMAALDHPHIVRLIGICEGDSFMLVMELAPLGPLNKYLRSHRDVTVASILSLMLQVASAMEYLESKQFVHRDLAARNLLLVNENFVKISDFGMSRALGLGKEYYRAEVAGKWPLKWYAPECIYYFKFSSKSDVWSFGITLWESFSYGDKPYQGMIGQDILKMFERNERLAKPQDCPSAVYNVMRKCWHYNAEDRPPFSEIYHMLKNCSSLIN